MNLIRLAAIFSFLPGLSHVTLQAYSHFGIPFYFGSFIVIGCIQIVIGILLWRGYMTPSFFWFATLVNGMSTVFWLLTRVWYTPFIGGTEHFSIIGVSVVTMQVLMIVLLWLHRHNVRELFSIVFLSIFLGFAAQGLSLILEEFAPSLKGTGTHSHGHGHGSDDEEHADKNHVGELGNYSEHVNSRDEKEYLEKSSDDHKTDETHEHDVEGESHGH